MLYVVEYTTMENVSRSIEIEAKSADHAAILVNEGPENERIDATKPYHICPKKVAANADKSV